MSIESFFNLFNQKQKLKTIFTAITSTTTSLTSRLLSSTTIANRPNDSSCLILSISCGVMAIVIIFGLSINCYFYKYK
jgi:hypothetical protein